MEKAISLQKEVVEVRGKIWGKNHYLYYENLEIMADMYHDADMTAEAIQALKKVIELIEYNPLYADYLEKIRRKINLYGHSDDRKDHKGL